MRHTSICNNEHGLVQVVCFAESNSSGLEWINFTALLIPEQRPDNPLWWLRPTTGAQRSGCFMVNRPIFSPDDKLAYNLVEGEESARITAEIIGRLQRGENPFPPSHQEQAVELQLQHEAQGWRSLSSDSLEAPYELFVGKAVGGHWVTTRTNRYTASLCLYTHWLPQKGGR